MLRPFPYSPCWDVPFFRSGIWEHAAGQTVAAPRALQNPPECDVHLHHQKCTQTDLDPRTWLQQLPLLPVWICLGAGQWYSGFVWVQVSAVTLMLLVVLSEELQRVLFTKTAVSAFHKNCNECFSQALQWVHIFVTRTAASAFLFKELQQVLFFSKNCSEWIFLPQKLQWVLFFSQELQWVHVLSQKQRDYKPKSPTCIHMQNDHMHAFKIL